MSKRFSRLCVLMFMIFLAIQIPVFAQDNSDAPVVIELRASLSNIRWQGDDVWLTSFDTEYNTTVLNRWDSLTGGLEVPSGFPPYTQFAWSPDGQYYVAHHDMGLWLWNAVSGEMIWGTSDATPPDYVAWSPDGSGLVTASYEEGVAYIRDLATGAPIFTLTPPAGLISQLLWSPDGTHIATLTTSTANWLNIWDAATGAKVVERDFSNGGQPTQNFIEWNGDGTRLLVWDSSLQLIDAATGATLLEQAKAEIPFYPQWSPDRMRLLAMGPTSTEFVVWDTATDSILYTLSPLPEEGTWYSGLWSPDGTHLVVRGTEEGSSLVVFDAATGERLGSNPFGYGLTPIFEYSPDGRFIAAQGMTSPLMLLDGTTGALLFSMTGSYAGASVIGATPLAWSSDSSRMAGLGGSGVLVWDTATGAIVADMPIQLSQPGSPSPNLMQLVFQPASYRLAMLLTVFTCESVNCPSEAQIWSVE